MIQLRYCQVMRLDSGVCVQFHDGYHTFTGFECDQIRRNAAEWVGLGDDLPNYVWEHEVGHAFLAEKMWDRPCPVLWNAAHGVRGNITASKAVERWVYWWQRYLRITPTTVIEPEWPIWRREWFDLVGAAESRHEHKSEHEGV